MKVDKSITAHISQLNFFPVRKNVLDSFMWFLSLTVLWLCYVGRNVLVTFVRQSADYYYYIILYIKTLDPHLTMAL